MALFLIFQVFIIAFFGNLFVEYQILPPESTLLTEISVYFLFCYALIRKTFGTSNTSSHLWYIYTLFIISALCSAFLNGYLGMRLLIGLRPVLRFYIFYLALINLGLTDKQYKNINKLIFLIFFLQLPASAIRFMYYGISELTIGTWGSHGGGLTPIIPIIALGYLVGFYIFWKKKIIFPLLSLAFILFGIVGAKRVLFFLYPVAFLGIYYLGYIKGGKVPFYKHLGLLVSVIAVIIFVQIFMMKNIDTLNPEHKVHGSINYSYVLDYAKKYETQEAATGGAGGRFSTLMLAYKTVFKAGIGHVFFGFGSGSATGSKLDKNFHLDKRISRYVRSYGQSGMTHILVEYGLFGLLLIGSVFLIFIRRSLKWFDLEVDPYWKAIAMGTVVFAVLEAFIFFFYNATPIVGDTIVPVYFYVMSLTFYRLNKLKVD